VNNHKNKNLRSSIYHGYYTFIFLEKVTLYILGIDLATGAKFRRNLIMFGWWGSLRARNSENLHFVPSVRLPRARNLEKLNCVPSESLTQARNLENSYIEPPASV